jgi:hypothetical protein
MVRLVRRSIEFAVEDGTLLRGDWHPAVAGRGPAVVMAHGFSGVKEQIDHYAARFAAGGMSVLVYDHRGFGASDGAPRQEIDPARQIADWRDAVTVALAQPETDTAARAGIWGSSLAGGMAIALAADDTRVGCVVAQIPHVSGHQNGREMFSAADRAALRARFAADRRSRLAGAPPERIPVLPTAPGQLGALPPHVSPRYVESVVALAPTWKNEVTLRSLENVLAFEPVASLPHLAPSPLLMIVAMDDAVTFPHLQLAAFAQASEPKRLVLHPGGHFDTYVEHFPATSGAALEWFREHLSPAGAPAPAPRRDGPDPVRAAPAPSLHPRPS